MTKTWWLSFFGPSLIYGLVWGPVSTKNCSLGIKELGLHLGFEVYGLGVGLVLLVVTVCSHTSAACAS